MADATQDAWTVISVQMKEIARRTEWLAEADKNDAITPAYEEVKHNLELAKARARGAAQVLALFIGSTPGEVASEATRRFKAGGKS